MGRKFLYNINKFEIQLHYPKSWIKSWQPKPKKLRIMAAENAYSCPQ